MHELSIKYFIRDQRNRSFFIMLFLLLFVLIISGLVVNFFSYHLIDKPSEEAQILISSTKNSLTKLNLNVTILSCSDFDEPNCQVAIKMADYNEVIEILNKENIDYILYSNTKSILFFTKLRFILIGVMFVIFWLISFLAIVVIKGNMPKRQNTYLKLNYLGASQKQIKVFELTHIKLLFALFYLISHIILLTMVITTKNVAYYIDNYLFINIILIIYVLYFYFIYYLTFTKKLKRKKAKS